MHTLQIILKNLPGYYPDTLMGGASPAGEPSSSRNLNRRHALVPVLALTRWWRGRGGATLVVQNDTDWH